MRSTALTYSEERRRKRRRSTYSTLLCIGAPERNKFCRAYGAAMKMGLGVLFTDEKYCRRQILLMQVGFRPNLHQKRQARRTGDHTTGCVGIRAKTSVHTLWVQNARAV